MSEPRIPHHRHVAGADSSKRRQILYLRYVEDRTQEEIGTALGVPQVQVSLLMSQIVHDLREELDPTG